MPDPSMCPHQQRHLQSVSLLITIKSSGHSYEHLALTPVQEKGPIAVQAKCNSGGICPLHSGLVSRKTNLNITPGIKTLDMAMMLF